MFASPALPLDTLLPWVFATWALCGLGAFVFFRRSRSPRHKRTLWKVLVVAGNAAFLAVVWLAGAPDYLVALAAGVAVIGTRRSIAMTRFCAACGGDHFPMHGPPPATCRRCGAAYPPAGAR
ncbi:hypothetical protein P6166_05900 [Stenotrophomonas sp. HITSZ_GD]|uniref:hypothetical protein n=1 Tax=Stenotrophomonas sp. HITSZ_GD TaxID=3037248 RepID=UPI00240D38D5|nr:hypothetical protein [Stenotrophomonas sp. HITSZ_GD]MDG2524883.1 hypothetical protein [Stenotrophomonas sp. HITSZ_GD]